DYRYFPDPDLLPVVLDESDVEKIRESLPELPDDKKQRFIDDLGLSPYDAGVLVVDQEAAAYFERVVEGHDAKTAANWVTGNLFGALNKAGLSISESPVTADALSELLDLMANDTISGRIAKDVFDEMLATGHGAKQIVTEKGMEQITDTGAIEAAVDAVIAGNPDQVSDFQGGNEKAIGWFVGQIMKATGGKANPKMVNDLLRKKLAK
ncbi:MAG: Asp-tRNA(Asn)/Glu-tRNA(Gln) amidotransferase GatCAB subunit B, partial [Rhodospirillales bacterium]|nr:Asp-tRNA(Asn)/Glu-tRNA(Gln) amidotransferase GatCAB subunit B [Rhodospirillales bacterium]